MKDLAVNDIIYYARILNDSADCWELKVHEIHEEERYFSATDNSKSNSGMTFLFNFNDIGKKIFFDRNKCVNVLNEV